MVKPILEELEIESFISYNGQYVVFEGEVIFTINGDLPLAIKT
jgi:hydroxymethylpyrimidine pyrophosphatase-like HAD family hydrolase